MYINGLTILSCGNVSNGVYTRGKEDTGVKLALYNAYTISESTSTLTKLVHNWNCDISTYGSSFTEGWLFNKTTYTVKHPVKPTETVYIDKETASKYTLNEYVYNKTVKNNLKFLDSLVIKTVE